MAVAVLLAAVLLTGCSTQDQPGSENLSAFSSIDGVYEAVDQFLDCEADPVGEPIVPMGETGQLTSEQRLCSENVQVDLYPDKKSLQESYKIWADSSQGEVHLVWGKNWLVVDVTGAVTGEPTGWDIERLAEELNGEYAVVG
ncbi:hypothetical protein [Arthrobacter roseus]|uniref:hypothetical protein n=1 Tax=Arthrobacter roseus TaxID=136274 RepID=UPI0019666AB0|nr:hypothetical protein [Arthrobacter roseus]MBM7848112.1 hypothetical protein [Arthrobacter roseus]